MKPVRWLGSSRNDMREMPKPVRAEFGFKLEQLEQGFALAPPHAKPLAGYQPAVDELRRTTTATPTVPSSRCDWRTRFTCCTRSRRSRSTVSG